MPRHPLLLLTILLPLASGCGGEVVEGTGAGTGSSGGAGSSSGGGSSGESPTTMTPTTAEPTTAEPTTGDASTGLASDTTSSGPGETGGGETHGTGSGGTQGEEVCGNGVPEPGELCDDGNLEQADGCTTMCRAPVSCLELLMLAPETPNESYDLDPEGDGAPIKFYCDMMGGGWTQVYYDEFNDKNGWSAGMISECGELGKVLGGAGQFGHDDSTQKQIGLQHVPHTQLRVIAEVAIIDSWDDETIFAEVDGQEVAKKNCTFWDANSCGQAKNQCGGPDWKDGNTTIAGDRDHDADIAVIKIRAELSEDANNEAWGLDTLYVFVK